MDSNKDYNTYVTTYDVSDSVTTGTESTLPFNMPLIPFVLTVSLGIVLIIVLLFLIIKKIGKNKKKNNKENEQIDVENKSYIFDGTEQQETTENNVLIECPNCHTKVKDKLDKCFMCGTKLS